jgi:hypothetical protein
VGEIFSLIAAEKASFPVSVMCRALDVNRISYQDWERRAPSDRALSDAWLIEKIKEIHAASDGTYGARPRTSPHSTSRTRSTASHRARRSAATRRFSASGESRAVEHVGVKQRSGAGRDPGGGLREQWA